MSVSEEKKQFPVILDLNERERKRFAAGFKMVSRLADELSEAIEKNDHKNITLKFITFTLVLGQLRELETIFQEVVKKMEKGGKDYDFPEFIYRK